MKFSKHLVRQLDIFKKDLKKREESITVFEAQIKECFDEMVAIKDYLGTVYNNDEIKVTDRTKIFMDKLKELEILGDRHDKIVKQIKEVKEKINRDMEIFINSFHQTDTTVRIEDVRNHILQYIIGENI